MALEAVLDCDPELRKMGLTPENILAITREGGAKDLKVLHSHAKGLADSGYSPGHMTSLGRGGEAAVQAVVEHSPALIRAGYRRGDIVYFARFGGGAETMKTLSQHHLELSRAGFPPDTLVHKMLCSPNGSGVEVLQKALKEAEDRARYLVQHHVVTKPKQSNRS
ncbi:hypothetical protein [Paraburkholderia sp. CI3]|uniref:hypothetical protein n=1 Tax=Paraburkholderia sp. CI3 TaxID=2991060 RepID=UPI003D1BC150